MFLHVSNGHAATGVATKAWAAYRSPDPRALEALLKTDTPALPFLGRAVARHLQEFPSDCERYLVEA